MKRVRVFLTFAILLPFPAPAQTPAGSDPAPVPVTVDNFVRAETDMYFAVPVKKAGLGKFYHDREVAPVDQQLVVRGNRDTLYSTAVFDLRAGPVTITLPEAGSRFRSLLAITEDGYMPAVHYRAGAYPFTEEQVGTRYVFIGIRTFFNPNDPKDVEEAHRLQDAVKVEQPKGPGKFEVPHWDAVSQKKIREALVVLYSTLPDQNRMFGTPEQVDPIRRLIGAAGGWGGNPESEALYINVTPAQNDGETSYRLTVPAQVPVDGFWSISVYDAGGYFAANPENAYSLNNTTAEKNPDGSVDIRFGGPANGRANHLPIVKGWNYLVRLYRPRPELLSGSWKFPEARPDK